VILEMLALLDTHVFLWATMDESLLSRRARVILQDSTNRLFVSVATVWEVLIKAGRGKLKLPGPPETFLEACMDEFGFESLPIELRHVVHTASLPNYHRDPFDRILVAQGRVEELPILTKDPLFARYGADVIW
jgi:PIN domain nuclease of toxin-antitoxin system